MQDVHCNFKRQDRIEDLVLFNWFTMVNRKDSCSQRGRTLFYLLFCREGPGKVNHLTGSLVLIWRRWRREIELRRWKTGLRWFGDVAVDSQERLLCCRKGTVGVIEGKLDRLAVLRRVQLFNRPVSILVVILSLERINSFGDLGLLRLLQLRLAELLIDSFEIGSLSEFLH